MGMGGVISWNNEEGKKTLIKGAKKTGERNGEKCSGPRGEHAPRFHERDGESRWIWAVIASRVACARFTNPMLLFGSGQQIEGKGVARDGGEDVERR